MAFRVEFKRRAKADLERICGRVCQEAPLRGPEWLDGLERAVLSLRDNPHRCPIVAELSSRTRTIRKLLYGSYPHIYRIYFTVEGQETVLVLHIRLGARRDLQRV